MITSAVDADLARSWLRALRPGSATNCLQCGEALPKSESQGRPRVYCDSCRNEHRHPKPLHVVCQYKSCGKELPATRNKHKAFCSQSCRDHVRHELPEVKEAERIRRRARYDADPEKANAERKALRDADREHEQERQRTYRAEHPGQKAAADAKRRASKRDQSPILTLEEKAREAAIYEEAQRLGWHVDHINPIVKGGLHHPDNLVAIPPFMNLSKHDDYWPDLHALQ